MKKLFCPIAAILAMMFTIAFIACGGSSKGDGTVSVTSVSVTPSTATISVGGTRQLTANVLPANATKKDVTWSSSSANVTFTPATGLTTTVTGVSQGSATITATTADGNKTGTCAITVGVPVASVTVPSTASITVGGARQLTATIAPANATNKTINWTNSAPATASISATTGETITVTAIAAGTTTITATTADGNKTSSCIVTVTAAPAEVAVADVTVNPPTANIPVGGTQQLTATIAPANATNKTVNWTNSTPATASISATTGETITVTAIAAGTTTITATTADGNKTASCIVTVVVPVASVTVNPTTANISVNGTQQLTATIAPANATNKTINWTNSTPATASISATTGETITVTAIAAGTTTITATTADGNRTASCVVTVAAAAGPKVYVAGAVSDGSYDMLSTLWIDEVPVRLNVGGYNSDAASVFVAPDNKTYVWGFENDAQWNSSLMLWVNNEPNIIPTTGISIDGPDPSGVSVAGSDVYLVASAWDPNYTTRYAVLWKGNTTALTFTPQILNSARGYAHSVQAIQNAAYVAGSENVSNIQTATVWVVENNTPTPRHLLKTSPNYETDALSVFVNNGIVYAAGMEYNPTGGQYAAFWIGDVIYSLAAQGFACANSVYISGGKAYVAGYDSINYNDQAKLWVITLMPDGTGVQGAPQVIDLVDNVDTSRSTVANSVFASGDDVYVVGRSGYDYRAMFWKLNGTTVTTNKRLDNSGNASEAKSVFVR